MTTTRVPTQTLDVTSICMVRKKSEALLRSYSCIGSTHARFRSVNEFVPHAFWLLRDQAGNPSCECKYCSKRPQREISFTMGLSLSGSPAPARIKPGGLPMKSLSQNAGRSREHRLRDQFHKPYAAVHRVPKPAERSGPKQKMLRERNSDLRAVLSDTGTKGKRWFREGELLWCELDSPILGKNGVEDGITFWPGLVQEVVLKIKPIPAASASGGEVQNSVPDDAGSVSRPTTASLEGKSLWDVDQSFVYKIKFLALEQSTTLPPERLLPYQAYSMSSALFNVIQEFPLDEIDISPEAMSAFNLRLTTNDLNDGYGRFENAVAPYTLAIQIASAVAGYWCPTDEWEFKFSVTPTSSSAMSRSGPGPSSLSVGSSHTDTLAITNAGSSGPAQLMSSGAENVRLLGLTPPPKPYTQIVTQTRFQGLWWGGERIWTDDIVRLKMSRQQLAPYGAVDIYPPSGPSKQTVEYHLASEHPPENPGSSDFGAGGRGVFMRLEGLFVVDIPREGDVGTRKECRACGMLYELADQEWEDPNAGHASSSKGDARAAVSTSGIATIPPESVSNSQPPPQSAPSFTPGSSSFKSASFTDTDLSVPPGSTTPTIAAQGADNGSLSANTQLSHPILSVPTQLPMAAKGFKFRPILTPGCEAVVSLSLVAGRYYPLLLSHPLLRASVEKAIQTLQEEGVQDENYLWSLEGLSPGFFNSVDPVKMKTSRAAMLRDAHQAARHVMEMAREQSVQLKAEKLRMERQDEIVEPEESLHLMNVDVDS
jgi:hypothetical protein